MAAPATVTWTNLYPGVDHATGANGGYYPDPVNPNNANILRIDLTASNIEFLTTPWEALDATGVKTTDFLAAHFDPSTMQAMLATNANFFDMSQRNAARGLSMSRGQLVTYPYSAFSPCGLLLTQANEALVGTPQEFDGFAYQPGRARPWTAVAGPLSFVLGSEASNPASNPTPTWSPATAARTAVGISQPDGQGQARYLYLLTIDGLDNCTNPEGAGYYGASMVDVAEWLTAAGAYAGICLDGGGSTTMAAIAGTATTATLLSDPHDDESSTKTDERHVAISFGVVVRK